MKKFLTALLCAITAVIAVMGFTACGNNSDGISVYMPDGAPALAMAQLMSENKDFGKKVNYHVVQAGEINSCVTYKKESKNADLCILPVNAASKLLGDGSRYKVLGTVTHGNLFILSGTDKADLTAENIVENLSGKKVGVVNFAAFPGAATKLVMDKCGVNNVNLSGVDATQVNGNESNYDYFVVPEPAASTKIANANLNLKQAGSLQTLYGVGGYPQAVLVAKNSLIKSEPEFIAQFTAAMDKSAQWLLNENTAAQTIFDAVKSHYADPENTDPAFKVNNLTKSVIQNCAISFEYAANCKEQIKAFLIELKNVGDSTATEVSDSFFYIDTAI